MNDRMAIDAAGGAGIAGIHNVRRLSYDKYAARGTEPGYWGQRYVGALCSSPLMASADIPDAAPVDLAPLTGAGLPSPETPAAAVTAMRREEHTSELQSLMRISYAVFCLKKKKVQNESKIISNNRTTLNTR